LKGSTLAAPTKALQEKSRLLQTKKPSIPKSLLRNSLQTKTMEELVVLPVLEEAPTVAVNEEDAIDLDLLDAGLCYPPCSSWQSCSPFSTAFGKEPIVGFTCPRCSQEANELLPDLGSKQLAPQLLTPSNTRRSAITPTHAASRAKSVT
jgi:hypothetical protein